MTTAKLALVTGASRGIGKAIAERLALNGFKIAGTATTPEGAAGITEHLKSLGNEGKGFALDLTDHNQIDQALKAVTDAFGPIQTLVNNAGITRDGLLIRMKDDDWDAVIATNLTSAYRLCKACVRDMMKLRNGRIINITSVVGSTGNAGQANYAASKAGIIGFTKSLAKELGSRNITVNSVAPGFIETDMTHVLSEDVKNNLLSEIPLGRLGSPKEIAGAVAFLCSDDASYITGETLHVNGGLFMP